MRHCRPCGQPAEECWCADDDDDGRLVSPDEVRRGRYGLPPQNPADPRPLRPPDVNDTSEET